MLGTATAKLHRATTALAETSARAERNPTPFVKAANEILAAKCDVSALLGTAQQELSDRRICPLQQAMPKDMVSLWPDYRKY